MDDERTFDAGQEELVAALRVRGHIQRVRAASAAPLLGPALSDVGRAHIGDSVEAHYQRLLVLAVATEATLTRLLVSHPDLRPSA